MYIIKLTILAVFMALLIAWALTSDWFKTRILGQNLDDDSFDPPVYGRASCYGESYRGKRMANGERFDPDRRTCAAWRWPLGTFLRVERGNRSVIVQVTDRGPNIAPRDRIIDLSLAAFEALAPSKVGLIDVSVRQIVDTKGARGASDPFGTEEGAR